MNDLDSTIKILYKTQDNKLIKKFILNNKLDKRVLKLINEEALCETFKWTYKELQETEPFIIDVFSQILDSRAECEQKELNKKYK